MALAGQYLKRLGLDKQLDSAFPVGAGGIANSDIVKSYLGLLAQGKNDFEASEALRGDDFFAWSLAECPLSPPCASGRGGPLGRVAYSPKW